MKIAVAATAPFGAAVLEGMANRGYDIEFLLTRPDKPQGRGRKKAAPPAKEVAKRSRGPRPAAGQADRLPRRSARGRHRGLRGADPGEAPRRAPLAERAPVASPPLARSRASGARDHGWRPRDRRHHPQDDRGPRRGPHCGSAPLSDRAAGRHRSRCRAGGGARRGPHRRGLRRAHLRPAAGRRDLRGEAHRRRPGARLVEADRRAPEPDPERFPRTSGRAGWWRGAACSSGRRGSPARTRSWWPTGWSSWRCSARAASA